MNFRVVTGPNNSGKSTYLKQAGIDALSPTAFPSVDHCFHGCVPLVVRSEGPVGVLCIM